MADIIKLPKDIAELIAAGEVIERPASVIKELCENAIDAGATAITAEIQHGGIVYMRVTDNGSGIKKDQIKTAFLRHATSKIHTKDDLDKILSLGFRGEALASICAVARVEVLSAVEGENGVKYSISGGEEQDFFETGCPKGTTVIVRDLFYNTPARMKFLKSDMREGSNCSAIIERLALSHPEISFKLIKDGKTVLNTVGDGKLKSAAYSVLGKDFTNNLLDVDLTEEGISVTGFCCKPNYCKPSRAHQYFFVNGRFVKSGTCSAALTEAYKNSLMVGKYPSCILYVDIPPETVDVNVHPTKTEVRFSDEKRVFTAVFHAVKDGIFRGDDRPNIVAGSKNNFFVNETADQTHLNVPEPFQFPHCPPVEEDDKYEIPHNVQINPEDLCSMVVDDVTRRKFYDDSFELPPIEVVDCTQRDKERLEAVFAGASENLFMKHYYDVKPEDVAEETPKETEPEEVPHREGRDLTLEIKQSAFDEDNTPTEILEVAKNADEFINFDMRIIGEAFSTYIIAEYQNCVYFIDKHAAHERIIFNSLQHTPSQQLLLTPVILKLDNEQYATIIENIELLAKYSFTVEDFGDGQIMVRGVPAVISHDFEAAVIEIAEKLSSHSLPITKREEELMHTVSCRGAIKAGKRSPDNERVAIAKAVLSSNDIMYCPHGRSVAFKLSRKDFEKQFGRSK
ncbi:MAG: DNA mismatch repair endonuclease MutL [Oscillospiraceae bacterium]|nr:DNA mismatch repair endonuclease MutL [Candidatus Equicaccousia limihippi]